MHAEIVVSKESQSMAAIDQLGLTTYGTLQLGRRSQISQRRE